MPEPMGKPAKKKLPLPEQNIQRSATVEHKLETGDYREPSAVACPNPSGAPPPAVEIGDPLEISWKTFLSVLRSMEECSESMRNSLVPQFITSQPVLPRKKISAKSEKIRKGRSSALPVILKPGEKPNLLIPKPEFYRDTYSDRSGSSSPDSEITELKFTAVNHE